MLIKEGNAVNGKGGNGSCQPPLSADAAYDITEPQVINGSGQDI